MSLYSSSPSWISFYTKTVSLALAQRAYIGDIFGTKEFSAIHGYILTAYSTAGLIGPYFASWIHDITGSYQETLMIFSGMFAIGLVISIWIRFDIRSLERV